MEAVITFFEGIASVLTGAVNFLIGIIQDLVYMIQLTAKAVAAIPSYLSWLPSPVVALLVTTFGVVVIYKILGRE